MDFGVGSMRSYRRPPLCTRSSKRARGWAENETIGISLMTNTIKIAREKTYLNIIEHIPIPLIVIIQI